MNNPTDLLFVFDTNKEKQAMQRRAVWKFAAAVALFSVGAYSCFRGPSIVGVPLVALGGFFAGLAVSRMREAAGVDDVFRG